MRIREWWWCLECYWCEIFVVEKNLWLNFRSKYFAALEKEREKETRQNIFFVGLVGNFSRYYSLPASKISEENSIYPWPISHLILFSCQKGNKEINLYYFKSNWENIKKTWHYFLLCRLGKITMGQSQTNK